MAKPTTRRPRGAKPRDSKKQRRGKRAGTVEWVGQDDRGCYHARITLADGNRRRIKLVGEDGLALDDQEQDRALAEQLLNDLLKKIRSGGRSKSWQLDAKKKKKKLPYGMGTIEWRGQGNRGCWFARVSVPGGQRARFKLTTKDGRPLNNRKWDRVQARKLAGEISKKVRKQTRSEQRQRQATQPTVQQFGEQWTSGKLYEQHGEVNGLRLKKSASDDESRLSTHVYPLIGKRLVAEIEEVDIEYVMGEAPRRAAKKRGKPLRQATKLQIYQVMRRLFDLARRPGRLREDNPVAEYLRPSKDKPKLFAFLYPSEVLALLECTESPLARRILYALAIYTGLRLSSLLALWWSDVDFEHGTLTVRKTKTGIRQLFEVPADLSNILRRWYEHCRQPALNELVLPDIGCRKGGEAEALRTDLHSAGVERAQLFARNADIQPLRFHDCRGTFVTWALRQGRSQAWICDRTGHVTKEQMEGYARTARTLADLNYEPFPDITNAVPELSKSCPAIVQLSHKPVPNRRIRA